MSKNIVILGAGGVAREVHDIIEAINEKAYKVSGNIFFKFIGFIAHPDDNSYLLGSRGPLLGADDVLAKLPKGTYYVIGIGSGSKREELARLADEQNLIAATLIHPNAYIGNHLNSVNEGSVIAAHSSLTTNISVGRHVFIDRNVTIGHDANIGDFVSLFPAATVSGNVVLNNKATVGTGGRVLQGLTVGESAFIGAGAVVVDSVPANTTVVGVPARDLIR